jgi:hypothetical protein
MGVLAPGSANTWNIFGEYVWEGGPQNLTNFLTIRLTISGNSKHLFQEIVFLCDLNPHAKFQNPRINHFGKNVSVEEERKKNSGQLVPLQWTQAAWTKTTPYNFGSVSIIKDLHYIGISYTIKH